MRNLTVGCLLVLFLLWGGGVPPSSGQVRETESGGRMTIALDLMDLDIPGEGIGEQMELPPIVEPDEPPEAVVPPAPEIKPDMAERSKADMPSVSASAPPPPPMPPPPSPPPGVVPFLLDGAEPDRRTTRALSEPAGEADPDVLIKEIPAELKSVPPPPSRMESLKLPSSMDASVSAESEVPEIPLLKSEDVGQEVPVMSGGQDPSLTMKPLPGLYETPGVSRDPRPLRGGRRPEDYLQVREDIDSRLIEIFERYYKDR